MRGSIKANLIVFLTVAVIAFCASSAFATLTIHEDNDSYKLMAIEDDSFEPTEIEYVPTYIPKNTTNTTNTTDVVDTVSNNTTTTDPIDYIETTIDNLTDDSNELEYDYRDD